MKHIRLFEDYSDEELRDLQKDLEGIGHEYKLLQKGKDFGYHVNLREDVNQGYPLYLTKTAIKKLVDKGVIEKKIPSGNYYHFVSPRIVVPITPFGTNLFRIAFYGDSNREYLEIENYLSDLIL